jgi:Tfp pilus assembly protein PilF
MSKRPPSSPSHQRPNAGDQALEAAIFALRMQRPYEAESLAADILKVNRGNAGAARVLGQALLMQNRPDEAIAALEKGARRSEDPVLETLLATALAAAGRRDEALEQLRRTTARRPPFPPAFLEHGGQLASAGRFAEANAVLESGLGFAPDSVELRMELGFLHIKTNNRVKARVMLQQAIALAPQRPDVLTVLAKVMALDGDYAAAADTYRRALGLRPDDSMSRNNLGACLLELGEREAGEASIRMATRDPQMAGHAITSLSGASHGRFFLRPSNAAEFLRGQKT